MTMMPVAVVEPEMLEVTFVVDPELPPSAVLCQNAELAIIYFRGLIDSMLT